MNLFPRLQFIVTTHSPYILNSLSNTKVYDLDNCLEFEDLSIYSSDDLVEGYFEVDGYSYKFEEKIRRYRYLKEKSDLTETERTERAKIRSELHNFPRGLSLEVADIFYGIEGRQLKVERKNLFRKERKNMESLLDFVKELSFVRVGGSAQERQAAEMILREINRAGESGSGIKGEFVPFQIPDAHVEKCSVKVQGKEIPCVPYLRSGEIDKECRLLYLDAASEIDFAGVGDLSDTAVLLNGLTDEEVYKRLVEHKAAAFLVLQGKYYFSEEEASLYPRRLREHFSRNGKIPGFLITAADAMALVLEETKTVSLTLKQEEIEKDSQDVMAVIPGTQGGEEEIVLTAHYDSVPLGTGSWDNATGAAALLGIYRHFAAHPPKRTLRFLWCGSEELGLLGSKAYITRNEDMIERIKFCFNFDMCGTALGENRIVITGNKELETFVDQYCKLTGYSAKTRQGVHSSDSAPFCDRGIPALGLSRGTAAAEIHTIHDRIPPISEKMLQKNVDFAIRMIGDMANAAVLPIKREMPEDRKKELDQYFHRSTEKKGKEGAGSKSETDSDSGRDEKTEEKKESEGTK